MFVLFCLAGAFPAVQAAAPQDDPAKDGHGRNVEKLARELLVLYKDKSHRDTARIVDIYQIFHDIYPKATKSEKKKMARVFRKGFDIKPFPEDSSFMCTAAACLSNMEEHGYDALLYALNRKTLRPLKSGDQIEAVAKKRIRVTIIEAIGFNRNPAALKKLYKLIRNDDALIVNAACQALSCFYELPLDQRKEVVAKLIDVYSGIATEAENSKEYSKEYDRLIIVECSFNSALQKLTLRTLDTAPDWREWYEEHKDKKKW